MLVVCPISNTDNNFPMHLQLPDIPKVTGKGLSARTTDEFNQEAYVQGRYDGKYTLHRTELKEHQKSTADNTSYVS